MAQRQVTRRRFSQGMLAAGTWAITAPSLEAQTAPSEKIRVGVVGMRNRGWKNAKNFHNFGPFEIATICDCDSAMFDVAMKQLDPVLPSKPKFETDFRKMLDDPTIDAVINTTPDHWHALVTVMAIQAGKHVFHEKPASYDINDGKAMVAASNKHPEVVVAMGTQQRSGQHFFDAKAFIDEGDLGPIGFARAWITHTRPTLPVVPDSDPPATMDYDMWCGPAPMRPYNEYKVHYNWHFQKPYGTGEAGNWGGHWLDVTRWLCDLDLPVSCQALGGTYVVHDAKETPDTQTFLFEYAQPRKMTVLWEQRLWTPSTIHNMSNGVEICGHKGTLIIDRGGWQFHPRDGEVRRHPGTPLDEPHVRNFAAAIKGDAKPAADIVEGHKSAILSHLGNISTFVGRKIEFDPKTQRIKGDKQAQAMEGREYRKNWPMPKI